MSSSILRERERVWLPPSPTFTILVTQETETSFVLAMILVHPSCAYVSVNTAPSQFNRILLPPALCCSGYTNYINVIEVAARARRYTHSVHKYEQFDLALENSKAIFQLQC
jgi:hypothetical protein